METTEIILKDVKSGRDYKICVTMDEAKRLATDSSFAIWKLNEVKTENKENNTMNMNWNAEESSQRGEETYNINKEVTGFKWPNEAILLLIEEYSLRQNDFKSGKLSQKRIWSLIANELMKRSYNVTGPQCLSKFSGLKRTYKAVKDHNNKSGNNTRIWPYLTHMDNLLGTKPFMMPVSIVSSTGKRSRSPSECSISSMDSSLENDSKPMYKKVRQSNNMNQLIQDFKDDRKIAEEAMERRHQENMDLRKKLVDSLVQMVDILKKK